MTSDWGWAAPWDRRLFLFFGQPGASWGWLVSHPTRLAVAGSNVDISISYLTYGDYYSKRGDIFRPNTFRMAYTETPDSHRTYATLLPQIPI